MLPIADQVVPEYFRIQEHHTGLLRHRASGLLAATICACVCRCVLLVLSRSLSVSLSVSVAARVSPCVCALSACLPACLPACMHAYRPTCLHACVPTVTSVNACAGVREFVCLFHARADDVLEEAVTSRQCPRSTLRTDGIYEYVRHPIYGGLVLLCLGIAVVTNSALRSKLQT